MEKLTPAAAKENFENVVKSVIEENKVYHIECEKDSAILISYKRYKILQGKLELLSIPGFRESFQISLEQIKNKETQQLTNE